MPKSPLRLVIDTATDHLYIGLFTETTLLAEHHKKGKNDHSVNLLKRLEKMFLKHALEPSDLEEVIVGLGPGSYTGVRIGVTVAKMLAWTLGIPLYTTSSLALMASGSKGLVLPYIDARRGNAFLGLYRVFPDRMETVADDRHTAFGPFVSTLREEVGFITAGRPDLNVLQGGSMLKKVENVHTVSPEYLRETAAVRKKESKE